MYAVIKTGGKQHKVKAGDVIEVEKIVHDGETMTFHPILVVDDDGKTHVGAGGREGRRHRQAARGEEGRQGQGRSSTGRRPATRSAPATARCTPCSRSAR